ncbi:hypothetical protein O7600_28575 [Micromonospora sp. WMMA1998]|uniref:hypothetical protein n=1 Tax=Micromonospora sp. WMMA1998 TaxID=3015167 RepID=UPI00248B464C|nr:hypothetical protein [Micromonospora sp. WMMA1998]WBC14970.1 hypothetical protein O7600_28575 [Micromonospora sp. WMMA1998]
MRQPRLAERHRGLPVAFGGQDVGALLQVQHAPDRAPVRPDRHTRQALPARGGIHPIPRVDVPTPLAPWLPATAAVAYARASPGWCRQVVGIDEPTGPSHRVHGSAARRARSWRIVA